MKRNFAPAMALVGLSALSATVYGQGVVATSNSPSLSWGGFYAGLNAGGVWNKTCSNWNPTINGAPISGAVLANCPSNNAFTGGVQAGYNFTINQIVLGLEADYNGWSSKSKNRQFNYVGNQLPQGIYTFSGKESPNGGGTVRLRFGYAIDKWLPYVTAGYAYASGSPTTAIYYAGPPPSTTNQLISSNTRTVNSSGWTAGAGVEYGVMQSLSVKLEYLYTDFGHVSKAVGGACTGSGCTWVPPAGFALNTDNSAKLDMVRLGVNWNFGGP
jgi:outer membrane immunogenic protein